MPAPQPDRPASFGYKCSWYAVRTNDTDAVVAALAWKDAAPSTWFAGIEAAYVAGVFITPPLGPWTLVVGRVLFDDDVPARLKQLSQAFGEAQFFTTYRARKVHVWGLARSGSLVRHFVFGGYNVQPVVDLGEPTPIERTLGIGTDEFAANEFQVMQIAGAWSVNPSELEERFKQPGLGRLSVLS